MPSATISEIYDLSTDVNKGTVLKIHAPGGNNVKRHLAGFFMQYKQFKYHGCKVTLVPASTLPADPLQLGYEAGEPTIDPRDMVNPILYRWYHGEAMLTDQLTFVEKDPINAGDTSPYQDKDYIGSSVDQQDYFQMVGNPAGAPEYPYSDAIYANCLMDPSFKKAGIQAGFSTFCRPYCYNLVTNQQYLPNREVSLAKSAPSSFVPEDGDVHSHFIGGKGAPYEPHQKRDDSYGQIVEYIQTDAGVLFTNKLQLLGWMDTVTRMFNLNPDVASDSAKLGVIGVRDGSDFTTRNVMDIGSGGSLSLQTLLPDIQMLYILMPPAYKTRFYFRLILKHYFSFRGFRSCFNVQSYGSASVNPLIPLNAVDPQTLATGLASYLEESASGGPDSVTVENGSIINAADGVTG